MADPFAPPEPDEHRQKTPSCGALTSAEEKARSSHADCPREHRCFMYRDHEPAQHRAKPCGHWFGGVIELTEAEKNALLKTFPPCNCGSVDASGNDIGEHEDDCPYHLVAIAMFDALPPRYEWTGAPQHSESQRVSPAQAIADEINATGGVAIDAEPTQIGRSRIDQLDPSLCRMCGNPRKLGPYGYYCEACA